MNKEALMDLIVDTIMADIDWSARYHPELLNVDGEINLSKLADAIIDFSNKVPQGEVPKTKKDK